MTWKFCANASFFGLRRDRFVEYQPARSLREKLALVAQVPAIRGVELKYPFDFADPGLIPDLLAEYRLEIAAVNVDTKDVAHFRHGALSAGDNAAREYAVRLLKEGMDQAAALGAGIVTTCPLADGHDYPFQVDHAKAWERLIDSVRTAAAHRRDVALLLEYQANEPHARLMLDNVGKALHVCAEVGEPNVGINLDVGHSFAARESPAEAAVLLSSKNLLRYIHSNDNTGDGGDWDMASGTVHFWHWLEFLYTLKRIGYEGWIGADIAPKHFGPVAAYECNFRMIERMNRLLTQVGHGRIENLLGQPGNSPEIFELLTRWIED